MVQKKLEKQIKKVCEYLEFYDKYGFFQFEKVRIDITLSGDIIAKLKEINNKSKFVEDSLKNKFYQKNDNS